MTNVSEWSTSAGSNNGAPPDGAPEGMLPGKVNDVIRENMAALAKWYQDQNGSLTTAGTGAAFTLTTNSVYTALNDIALLVFRTHTVNTGSACTLNVDGLGAKPLRKSGNLDDYAAGELPSGQIVVVAYNSGTDDFEVVGPAVDNPAAASTALVAPAGTAMIFGQTAAPTGWTKSLTHDNKALRLVTGTASSGGTTAFTSVFASRTLVTANLPAHTHGPGTLAGYTSTDGSHTHNLNNETNVMHSPDSNDVNSSTGVNSYTESTITMDSAGSHDHGVTIDAGITGSEGSGTAVDFAVQYVDVILATKD